DLVPWLGASPRPEAPADSKGSRPLLSSSPVASLLLLSLSWHTRDNVFHPPWVQQEVVSEGMQDYRWEKQPERSV
ncbi:MAG: hypothetical protein O7D30_09880, partial [Rickettsia endosymbiont of Ixodes persulcatus]|nr:hypothetical protein [Rickettsia endosymbiont of Ixodes persulcatus]